jgi:hypothetical protein
MRSYGRLFLGFDSHFDCFRHDNIMENRPLRKGARAILVYGQLIGFVSSLFMWLVFYHEAILHRGLTYIEPNLLIASVELVMVTIGAIICGATMILFVRPEDK